MKKRCIDIECGALNPSDALTCSVCDTSLAYADEVYDEEPALGTGGKGAGAAGVGSNGSPGGLTPGQAGTAGAERCTCQPPGPGWEATGTCFLCGLPVETSSAGGTAGAPPQPTEASGGAAGRISHVRVSFGSSALRLDSEAMLLGRASAETMLRQGCHLGDGSLGTGMELLAALMRSPTVSRRHVLLERAGQAVRVLDLGSHNGTWVNSHRLASGESRVVALDQGSVRVHLSSAICLTIDLEEQP